MIRLAQAGLLCYLLVAHVACSAKEPNSPQAVLDLVRSALSERDPGAIVVLSGRDYRDDLGGAGRLEDDIRQLFSVYGKLDLNLSDLRQDELIIRAQAQLKGRSLSYRGPLEISFVAAPLGFQINSGLLSDLRSILYTLRQRRIALEHGSLERLDAVVSMEYGKERAVRQKLFERLTRSFSETRHTAFMVSDLDIVVDSGRAQVTQSYLLITHVAERTLEHKDQERLILRKEGTRWRIVEGLG